MKTVELRTYVAPYIILTRDDCVIVFYLIAFKELTKVVKSEETREDP